MTDMQWYDLWKRASHSLALDAALLLGHLGNVERARVLAKRALRADERRSEALQRRRGKRVLIADGGPIREEVQP